MNLLERDFGLSESIKLPEKYLENITSFENMIISSGLTIAFDIDGVVADSGSRAMEMFNERYGTSYQLKDLKHYWATVDLFKNLGFGEEESKLMASDLWNSEECLAHTLPVPGSIELSSRFDRLGIKPFYITSRPGYTDKVTREWFRLHFPSVDKEHLVVQKKGDSINKDFKVAMVQNLGVDFFMEDSNEHALEIVKKTSAVVTIVKRGWNKDNRSDDPRIVYSDNIGLPDGFELISAYIALANKVVS